MHRSLLFFALALSAGCGRSTETSIETSSAADDVAELDPGRRPDLPEAELAAVRAQEKERVLRALAELEKRFPNRTPGLSFQVRRVETSSLGDTHVHLRQVFRGAPVEGRDILVVVFLDGQIRVDGTPDRFDGPSLPSPAGLSRARAWAKERNVALKSGGEQIWLPVYQRRLRPGARGDNAADWETFVARFESGTRVEVETGRELRGPRELFVRDRDGAIVERALPVPVYDTATLNGKYQTASLPNEIDSAGRWTLVDGFGNRVLAEAGYPPILYRSYQDNSWGDGQLYNGGSQFGPNGETAAADAMISLWVNGMLFRKVYGFNGFDNKGAKVDAVVHVPDNNAYAHPGVNQIDLGYADGTLADGGFVPPLHPMTDTEIVGHEVGHLTLAAALGTTTLPQMGEPGGISEGIADILGLLTGFYEFDALYPICNRVTCYHRTTLTVRGDWLHGNRVNPDFARSFMDPSYPAWTPALASYDGHMASGPLRRMFYFLTVGVLPYGQMSTSTSITAPQRDSPYLTRGLTGLGINPANQIFWRTLWLSNMSRVADYASFRQAMLDAAIVLYGKPHTAQYKAVEDAWAAVNVGAPADRDGPVVRITAVQKSRTEADITVEVDPDPSGISEGNVMIRPGNPNVPIITGVCTSRCTWTIDPSVWGSSTSHYVTVTATDGAANTTTKTQYFSLDVTPPSIYLTSKTTNPPDHPYQVWDAYFSDGMGLAWVNVKVDGTVVRSGSWQPYFKVYNTTLSNVVVDVRNASHGYHFVTFNAADDFGNTQTVTHALFTDRIAPQLCTLSIGSTTSWDTINLYLSGRDDDTGLKQVQWVQVGVGVIATGGGSAPGVTKTAVLPRTLPAGTYAFYAVCTDNQGNASTSPVQTKTIVAPQPPPPPPAEPCNTTSVAGSKYVDERWFELGKTAGYVTMTYETYAIPDQIDIYYQGTLIATTGCVATSTSHVLPFSYSGSSTQVKVRVTPNCNGVPYGSTDWLYRLSCP